MKHEMQCLFFLLVAPGMLFAHWIIDRDISVNKNEASVIFPRYIKFQLEASSNIDIKSVVLIYGIDRLSCQPATSRQVLDFEPGKQVNLGWELEFVRSGMIPPGAEIWWIWEITGDQGILSQTEKKSITVQDGRFEWQKLDRKGIIVQWHQGAGFFGQAILQYAKDDLQRLSSQMGIQPAKKIQIIVYASTEEMRTALVSSVDWVGAVALPDYSSILLGLAPADLNYADDYISHELTHLVVEELAFNCMGVELPTWLNEGLAENAQGEPGQEERDALILAIESQSLPALNDIASRFSADGEQARLEYTQSHLVVKYLLQTFEPQKMSDLLSAFQSGLMADEALRKVYGMDTAGVDSAWRKSLGFSQTVAKPVKQPTRTHVPTLVLSTAAVLPIGTPIASPSPIATETASPTARPASPTPAAASVSDAPIRVDPSRSPIPSCVGMVVIPASLFLFFMRRKESVP